MTTVTVDSAPAAITPEALTAILSLKGPWTIGVRQGRKTLNKHTWYSEANARRAFDELQSIKPGFTRFIKLAA